MRFRITPKTTQGWVDLVAEKDAEIARLKEIIAELSEALDERLEQRAREATK